MRYSLTTETMAVRNEAGYIVANVTITNHTCGIPLFAVFVASEDKALDKFEVLEWADRISWNTNIFTKFESTLGYLPGEEYVRINTKDYKVAEWNANPSRPEYIVHFYKSVPIKPSTSFPAFG